MIERDTVRLLRECDAGVQMGAAAISDVLMAYIRLFIRRNKCDIWGQNVILERFL